MGYNGEHNQKLHIALIATYPEMTKRLVRLATESDVIVDNYYASFENAVEIAKQIENSVDAILTRGGTGYAIKQNVDIPVITIPITPFDLYCSVQNLDHSVREVGFINFNRKLFGVEEIEKTFNVKIIQMIFEKKDDIEKNVNEMKARGIKTVIGGNVAAEYARQIGLNGIEITSGEEAIHTALQETIAIVHARWKEREAAERLSVAFQSISEGIVISDEKKEVVLCNTAAKNFFEIEQDEYTGLKKFLSGPEISKVYTSKEAEMNHIMKMNRVTTNVSYIPIVLEDKVLGAVSKMEDITKIQELEAQIRTKLSEKGFYAKYSFDDIVTVSGNMNRTKEIAKLYAQTKSTILIEGESGTGKELFAQSIHNESPFAKGPFVAVNCAAIPENLLESELFGYEDGSFTGAKKGGKAGLFEMANNGTLFLDEIGEIPTSLQARLLRVLQEKEIMRVGGSKVIPINVRIISATNKNLKERVDAGIFREDLYYRLNVFNVKIPPLRERKEDLPFLCKKFIAEWESLYCAEKEKVFADEIMPVLQEYDWPGNVRELRNIMERLDIFLKGHMGINQWEDMLAEISTDKKKSVEQRDIFHTEIERGVDLKTITARVEKQIIEKLLDENDNNQERVAKLLGIGKTTLWRKLTNQE